MSYTRQFVAAFGATYTGQTGNVGYTLKDTGGSVLQARTTTGVTESTVAPGTYLVATSLTDAWSGRIDWDITGQTGIGAVEDFGPRAVSTVVDSSARILTALPTAAAGTVGGLPTATNSSGQVVASSVVGAVGSVIGVVNANVVNIVVGAPSFSLATFSVGGPPISNVPAERDICIAAQTDMPITISVFNPDGTDANLSGAVAALTVKRSYGDTTPDKQAPIYKDSTDDEGGGGITISGNVLSIAFLQADTTPSSRIPATAKWSLKLWVGGLALAEGRGPFTVGPFGQLSNTAP